MIGQSAPIGEPNRFAEHITSLARRVRELELAAASGRGWVQAGTITVPFSAEQNSSAAVTFPHAFTVTPRITMTVRSVSGDTAGATLRISTPTTTGFTVLMRLLSSQTGSYAVDWQAIAA